MKEDPKMSKDGSCPYCGSRSVDRKSGHGVGAKGEGKPLPSIERFTYLCLNPKCGKRFIYTK